MDRITKPAIALFTMICIVTLTSCSYIPSFRFPGVYKINIQQGNVVDQDLIGKLKVGMSKKQVRYVMGTPLVIDTFNQNRWDYFYSLKTGKGSYKQKKLTLHFKNNILDSLVTDIEPTTSEENDTTAEDADKTTAKSDEKPASLWE